MPSFFWFDPFLRLGQNSKNNFVRFLEEMRTRKFASEIYWPSVFEFLTSSNSTAFKLVLLSDMGKWQLLLTWDLKISDLSIDWDLKGQFEALPPCLICCCCSLLFPPRPSDLCWWSDWAETLKFGQIFNGKHSLILKYHLVSCSSIRKNEIVL